MSDGIYIYYENLPNGIDEIVMPCLSGYTIYIDPRQSTDGMKRSYDHAMTHIRNHDFDKTDVQEIEYQAHKLQKGD